MNSTEHDALQKLYALAPRHEKPTRKAIRSRRYNVVFFKNTIIGNRVSKGRKVAEYANLTHTQAVELKAQGLRTSQAHRVSIIETQTLAWNYQPIEPKAYPDTQTDSHPAETSTMTEAILQKNARKNHNKVLNMRSKTQSKEKRYILPASDIRHPYHEMWKTQVAKNGFSVKEKFSGLVIFEGLQNEVAEFLGANNIENLDITWNGKDS